MMVLMSERSYPAVIRCGLTRVWTPQAFKFPHADLLPPRGFNVVAEFI